MAGYTPFQVGFGFGSNSFSTFDNQVAGKIKKGPNLNLLDVSYQETTSGYMLSAGQPVKLVVANNSDLIVVTELFTLSDDVLGIITYQQNPNYTTGDRFVIAQEGNIINMIANEAISVGSKVSLVTQQDTTLPSAVQTVQRVRNASGGADGDTIVGTVVSSPSTQADDIVAVQLKFEKVIVTP